MNKFFLLIISILLSGCSSSYEDCILENMKGVNNNYAAANVKQACMQKYNPIKDKNNIVYEEGSPQEAIAPELPEAQASPG